MRLLPSVSILQGWEHPASWDARWVIVLTVARLDFGVLAARPGDELYIDLYFGWRGVQFDWGAR